MKTRESDMPDEQMWAGFFSPRETLTKLGLTSVCRDVVDFGCGYGTFTIPAADFVRGTVFAFDIEPDMVEVTFLKAREAHLANVQAELRDLVAEGTGLPDGSVDFVMMFNILHCEEPLVLLKEAWRILGEQGRVGIIHWNCNPTTPRGPSMTIRPRPEQCRNWAEQVGFHLHIPDKIDLPPYHYGWALKKQ